MLFKDAFKPGARNPRYYVDLALVFPLIIATLQMAFSVASWPPSTWNLKDLAIGLAEFVALVLLAKEKAVTLGGTLGYVFLMGLIRLPMEAPRYSFSQIMAALSGIVAAGAGTIAICYWGTQKTEFYPQTRSRFDRIVVALAIVLSAAILFKPLKTAVLYYWVY